MHDQLDLLQAKLTPLAPLVHDALNAARIDTRDNKDLYVGAGRNWLRADLFRADLGDHLRDALPKDWTLSERERDQRGAILLRSSDGYIHARVQRVDSDGTIPEARSDRRREFYNNCDLGVIDLNGRCKHNLVLTFKEKNDDLPFEVCVIRPHRKPALVYSIPMPGAVEDFTQAKFHIENKDSYHELFGDDFGTQAGDLG